MKFLIDTCIWSLVLRRNEPKSKALIDLFSDLIDQKLVVLCGPVRQELLSGIKLLTQYNQLKSHLRYFEDLVITTADYELAAEYYNLCRLNGIQGSNTDFLLCALSFNNNLKLLTVDRDFLNFKKVIDFKLEFLKI
jgi:predicted nucleic acid-binding protein